MQIQISSTNSNLPFTVQITSHKLGLKSKKIMHSIFKEKIASFVSFFCLSKNVIYGTNLSQAHSVSNKPLGKAD